MRPRASCVPICVALESCGIEPSASLAPANRVAPVPHSGCSMQHRSRELRPSSTQSTALQLAKCPRLSFAPPAFAAPVTAKPHLSLSSFTQPPATHRIDLESGEQGSQEARKIPLDPLGIEVNQICYTSKDGTRIPMFVVHQARLELTGDHPTWPTGCGGFLAALTPAVRSDGCHVVRARRRLCDGEFEGRKRVRRTLASCRHVGEQTERLRCVHRCCRVAAERGCTNPSRLAIRGYSDSGLLVAAALTQRPDLFRAVMCGFRELDMVRFYTFTAINNLADLLWTPRRPCRQPLPRKAW